MSQMTHLLYILFFSALALGGIGSIAWWMYSVGRQERDNG